MMKKARLGILILAILAGPILFLLQGKWQLLIVYEIGGFLGCIISHNSVKRYWHAVWVSILLATILSFIGVYIYNFVISGNHTRLITASLLTLPFLIFLLISILPFTFVITFPMSLLVGDISNKKIREEVQATKHRNKIFLRKLEIKTGLKIFGGSVGILFVEFVCFFMWAMACQGFIGEWISVVESIVKHIMILTIGIGLIGFISALLDKIYKSKNIGWIIFIFLLSVIITWNIFNIIMVIIRYILH
ncbi:MAG: hypothetical protein KJ887_04985 [Candidatus Omnitrophica bacterium]|nr:hypothetical protein [Candidatus Omnitrophota bacterium]MBU1047030.1 hypothetical protein [Candidatus Omnitrophota bacterium]MBU1767264.1 hypothetical protein [Candidatus Omnitrophota bacterium]MBU1889300.1 hypothetical protein [Candidatus Omnitrophota bacterium]